METKRVVITGMGAITPLGNDVDTFWQGIRESRVGIGPITRFDAAGYGVSVAAEVKDFDPPEAHVLKKERKRMDLFSLYALAAAGEAVDNAGLGEADLRDNLRAGVMVGSGIGGMTTIQEQIIKMHDKGPDRMSPLFIPMGIANMAAGNIAIKYGMTGICTAIVTACATGTHSIGEAFRNIKHGYSDIILAGGTEASVIESGIGGFAALTALTSEADPLRASIPFDKDRSGFVMGEGAGVLVLEELEHAKARGAKIYGEVVGYGATGDAYNMTAPRPDGSGAAAAMKLAMEEAGITPAELGYINAHGTSTPHNDLPETDAVKLAMGDAAYKIPMSSTKSMTGHLLGAAGAIEAIVCLKAMEEGFIPATAGLETPGEGCDLDYVPKVGREASINYALSNSLGFGGHNGVICLKKWVG